MILYPIPEDLTTGIAITSGDATEIGEKGINLSG